MSLRVIAPVLLVVAALTPVVRAEPDGLTLRKKLSAVVEEFRGYEDAKTTLKEALDHLADVHCFTWRLNERAFKEDKIDKVLEIPIADPKPIPAMKSVQLETALRVVLERASDFGEVDFVIRPDHLEITTRAAVVKEFYPDRPRGALPPLVYASFKEATLSRALRDLSSDSGGNVLLDNFGAKNAAKTLVTADFVNVPLDDAVRLLADMGGLKAVLVGRVYYVTTKEKAEALQSGARGPMPKAP